MAKHDQICSPQTNLRDAMKAIKLLHKKLFTACPEMHVIRLKALMAGVTSAITEHQLTVTGLGRNLKSHSNTRTKHDIKRMDRLVGNRHLHAEREKIYQYLSRQLIGQQKHPVLIADWSGVAGHEQFHLLRIAIPMGGRSLTIYESCFKEHELNKTSVHNAFLDRLEHLLPEGCQPIILTDAIFKTPWFKTIESTGWYWIGRVRGNVQLSLDGQTFQGCGRIMEQATARPKKLGKMLYSKSSCLPCQAVIYRGRIKDTHRRNKYGALSRDTNSLYHGQKATQPWLLAYHLPASITTAKQVVQLYRYRMQIEEGFRDTKNPHYGIGLSLARSKSTLRYNNLLLIATLTQFLLWCIGKVAVDKNYHHHLQANTIRHKTVLSHGYIAMQIVDDKRYKINMKELRMAFEQIDQFTLSIDHVG